MEFKNDLGKPAVFEEDGYTVTRAAAWSAPGCHPTGCGVKLYTRDGKLCKIEGDENHPVTKGRLCVRCLTLTDFTYHPDRIIYPMKRAREDRGKDKFERITWDEAYAIIEENVSRIKREYGAETIFTTTGTGRETSPGVQGHMVVGTCNAEYLQSGFACYGPRVSITQYILGAPYPEIDFAGGLPDGYDDPNYVVPEMIVQWGKEPLASNGDGLFGHAVLDLKKRGAKIMTIDPRITWMGANADYVLQLRPGTDAALGMAFLNTIIEEELYDKEFVEYWCYGFEQLAARVATMPAERAGEICGIDPEYMKECARAYANAKPAAIAWGLAMDQNINGVQAGHCCLCLMAITGNIDVPGGQILQDIFDGTGDMLVAGLGWSMLDDDLKKKIIGLEEYPAYITMTLNAHADRMLDAAETGKPYKPHALWIASTNFLAPTCSAQPKRWYNALKDLDFVWASDCWKTPTIMALADVVLPIASFAEHDSVVPTHYGATPNYFSTLRNAVTVGETKGEYQNYYDLGSILNPKAWESFDGFLDFQMKYYFNESRDFEELAEGVTHQRVVGYYKYKTGHLRPDGKPGFNTKSGRIELYAYGYEQNGDDPLPYFSEPPYSPVSRPDCAEKYPFILTTGARTYCYFHSEGRQIPFLREINPDPLFEINPADAEAKGIQDGDWVRIENMFGFCLERAKITPTIKPGVVHAQHGWWFPEESAEAPHLYGTWKSNINSLIPHSRNGKLGFGAPYKAMLCDFRKAEAADFEEVDIDGLEQPGGPKLTYDDNFYRIDQDSRYTVGFTG